MHAFTHDPPVSYTSLFRSAGRVGGIVVIVSWVFLAVAELFRHGPPAAQAVPQGIAIATIFTGYIIGWHKEFIGGMLTSFATMFFYILCVHETGVAPPTAAILLALPGIFFLMAWASDRDEVLSLGERRHEH